MDRDATTMEDIAENIWIMEEDDMFSMINSTYQRNFYILGSISEMQEPL